MEPTTRVELVTSFLPRTCSTTELCGRFSSGAGGGIRTPVAQRRQIYSLVVLATHPPLQAHNLNNTGENSNTRLKNKQHKIKNKGLEPREGVEPTTCWLQISCSAIELPRQIIKLLYSFIKNNFQRNIMHFC